MRLLNIIRADIHFQFRYGFYFLYGIFTLLYLLILFAVPDDFRSKAAALLIYSDPTIMGLFFMGAVVLLEKSQHIMESLAVSPMRFWEYLLGKTVSLALLGTLSAAVLCAAAFSEAWFTTLLSVFFGSLFFSLLGLAAAFYSTSLNRFFLLSAGAELVFFLPGLPSLFGRAPGWLGLHPGVSAAQGICGGWLPLFLTILWAGLAFLAVHRLSVKKFIGGTAAFGAGASCGGKREKPAGGKGRKKA